MEKANKPFLNFVKNSIRKIYSLHKKVNKGNLIILNYQNIPNYPILVFGKHSEKAKSSFYPYLISSVLKSPTCFYGLESSKYKKISELIISNEKYKNIFNFIDSIAYIAKRKTGPGLLLDVLNQISIIPDKNYYSKKLLNNIISKGIEKVKNGYNLGIMVDGKQNSKRNVGPGCIEIAAKTGLDFVVVDILEKKKNTFINISKPRKIGFDMSIESSLSEQKYKKIRKEKIKTIEKVFDNLKQESELYPF